MLKAENLTKRVSTPEGELTILDNISFHVERSEVLAIIGASGSGKSTLLGLLAGLDLPSSGQVILDEVPLSRLNEEERAQQRRERIGFVFQAFHLMPNLTALENVMLPLELRNHPTPREAALQELAAVGLEQRRGHYPNQLSGGEQQRVAIARAYAPRPPLLLADEPTGNLDYATGQRIIDLLLGLQRDYRTTLILVSHDRALIERCDRVLALESGRRRRD